MNEFIAFLKILWEIVRFLLDAASYTSCFVLAALACVVPWRAVAIAKLARRARLSRCECVFQFFRSLVEVIALAFLLPSLVIPTRLIGFVHLTRGRGWEMTSEDAGWYLCYWFLSPFQGIAELFAATGALLSVLSVVRLREFAGEFRRAWTGQLLWTANLYNCELCCLCVSLGALAMWDILMLPLLLVLGMTLWRLRPVLRVMQSGVKPDVVRAVIVRQFARLCVDVFAVAPSALLVGLSCYRIPSLVRRMRALTSDPVRTHEACEGLPEQCEIMRMAGLVLLDFACLPLLLPVLVTGYRAKAVTGGLEGMSFHAAVLNQFGQMLLDLPFLIGGLLVVLTVYRADLVLKLLRSDAGTAYDRRMGVAQQLLRVAGDLASLLPLAVVVGSVYRICPLVLSLKVGMSRMLREGAEMELREWQFTMPRPRGKPCLVARATKSANLAGISRMRLHVVGDGFWNALAEAHGGVMAAVGRALLPLNLKDGKEVDFNALQHGSAHAELAIELDISITRGWLQNFLQRLPVDCEVLLQLEATLQADGRKVVLLAVPCRLGDLTSAVSSEDDAWRPPSAGAPAAAAADARADEDPEVWMARHLAMLRGEPRLIRDAWLPIVMAEFLTLLVDAVHLLIALLLLLVPWRFVMTVRQLLEPTERREARPVRKAAAALAAWDQACDRIMAQTDRLANRYAKAACEEACRSTRTQLCRAPHSESEGGMEQCAEGCVSICCCLICPCCPNYNHGDSEDFEVVRSSGRYTGRTPGRTAPRDFDRQLQKISDSLMFFRALLARTRKAWPDSPAWLELSGAVDAHLKRRSEAFFWLLLRHEVHILQAGHKITHEEHTRVTQAIRIRALPLLQDRKGESARLQEAFGAELRRASSAGKWGLEGKSKALLFSLLRDQLTRAVTDLFAALLALLLLLTGYRLPRIRREIGPNADLAYLKVVLQREALFLAQDLLCLAQFLALSALLTATVVKLPDLLARLRPARGLRKARDCAAAVAVELFVGIGELLLLLTAWKTYRLLASALVFGALSPVAMIAMALPGAGKLTRCRFSVASACWLGMVATSCFAPGQAFMMAFIVLLALAFSGFSANRIAGWTQPRGGKDWWSPVVRCTFPNLLVLLAIASDAGVLASEGLCPGHLNTLGSRASTAAMSVAAVTLLLETIPMVSPEVDQEAIVASHAWQAASNVCKQVLFLPVVAVLGPSAVLGARPECAALAFYLTAAVLSPTAWDVDLPYGSQLDIRSVGLCASGRRLLLLGAVLAGAFNHPLFAGVALASGAWSCLWLPCGGSASLWPELLRFGAGAGAAAAWRWGAEGGGQMAVLITWSCCCAAAFGAGLASWVMRRRRLAASQVPQAMACLAELQRKLCVWGGEALPALRADADVSGTARRVLDFEERLPVERLRASFFRERHAWRTELTNIRDYEALLPQLDKLRTTITEPITRVLLSQVLSSAPVSEKSPTGRKLGPEVAGVIASFCVPQVKLELPPPPGGWERGKLDLAELRSLAAAKAHELPRMLQAQVGRSQTVARPPAQHVVAFA